MKAASQSKLAAIKAQRFQLEANFAVTEAKFKSELESLLLQEAQLESEINNKSPKRTKLMSTGLNEITLYFDGASKGNPGEGGGGWVASTPQRTLAFGWNQRALCTNNEAEYIGLIEALRFAVGLISPTTKLAIKGDSTLVVKQVLGQYKCNAVNLVPYCNTAKELYMDLALTHQVSLTWVPREENKIADALSNLAITQGGDKVYKLDSEDVLVDEIYLKQRFN